MLPLLLPPPPLLPPKLPPPELLPPLYDGVEKVLLGELLGVKLLPLLLGVGFERVGELLAAPRW